MRYPISISTRASSHIYPDMGFSNFKLPGLLLSRWLRVASVLTAPDGVDAFKQFARNNLAIIVWPAQPIFALLRYAHLNPVGIKSSDLTILAGVLTTGARARFCRFVAAGRPHAPGRPTLAGTISAARTGR